ncbi:MAG: hypothetical protein QOC92_1005 [Acidimicrobiaceae bacterium]
MEHNDTILTHVSFKQYDILQHRLEQMHPVNKCEVDGSPLQHLIRPVATKKLTTCHVDQLG